MRISFSSLLRSKKRTIERKSFLSRSVKTKEKNVLLYTYSEDSRENPFRGVWSLVLRRRSASESASAFLSFQAGSLSHGTLVPAIWPARTGLRTPFPKFRLAVLCTVIAVSLLSGFRLAESAGDRTFAGSKHRTVLIGALLLKLSK